MTGDEFIAMARKAGITVRLSINYDTNGYWEFEGEDEDLKRFAALVAEIVRADAIADEREACAKVCEDISPKTEPVEYGDIRWGWKYKCPYAAAIRGRT